MITIYTKHINLVQNFKRNTIINKFSMHWCCFSKHTRLFKNEEIILFIYLLFHFIYTLDFTYLTFIYL